VEDQNYHQMMADLLKQQPQPRPQGVNPEDWRNRNSISAKLTSPLYAALQSYCRENGYSVNSALKQILSEKFFNG